MWGHLFAVLLPSKMNHFFKIPIGICGIFWSITSWLLGHLVSFPPNKDTIRIGGGCSCMRKGLTQVYSATVYLLLGITGLGWDLHRLRLLLTPRTGDFPYFLSGWINPGAQRVKTQPSCWVKAARECIFLIYVTNQVR